MINLKTFLKKRLALPSFFVSQQKENIAFSKYILITASLFLFSSFSSVAQKQLNITAGSYLILNGNVALVTNNAAINNNGTIIPSTATFYFTGNSDTTLSYVTGQSTTTCTNLTINKSSFGTAIKSPVHVTNVLTMSAGNLYADSNLTLISTAANTARVASVPASCTIAGKAFVQRYIPASRSWRLLTAPVTSSNTIYNTWQNGGVYTVGSGMFVTSPVPSSSNGIDPSTENNYSLLTFNTSTQGFNGVTNTNINISQGNNGSADNTGYMTFVRGDRNPSNLYIPNTNITTLTCAGKLQTGNQTFTVSGTSGKYTLIGNPYASPFDFSQISRTNVINRFYVWDPTLNTLGAFVALDDIDGDGVYDKSVAASSQTTEIQSGQAFLVQTNTSSTASITISESNKSTTNNTLIFRPAQGLPKLVTNLYLLNPDSSTIIADGALEEFDNRFSDSVNLDDVKKLGNINENLGYQRYGSTLAMERRPDITLNDTLFVKLTSTTRRNYQLQFVAQNINHPELNAYLQDLYLKTSTLMNLTGNTVVNFSINADAASSNANRFQIVFRPASIVPVTFISIKAAMQNTNIAVEWQVENETSISKYEIEKSTDGENFSPIGIVNATGNNNSTASYNWLDTKPVDGYNYYRIESINTDGSFKYSEVVKVAIGSKSQISIYPNPIQNNTINIQFNNQPLGDYQAQLINDAGQVVYKNNISVTTNNVTEALPINHSLSKGIYELKLEGPAGNNSVQKISVQ
jgi:hypothetical protein